MEHELEAIFQVLRCTQVPVVWVEVNGQEEFVLAKDDAEPGYELKGQRCLLFRLQIAQLDCHTLVLLCVSFGKDCGLSSSECFGVFLTRRLFGLDLRLYLAVFDLADESGKYSVLVHRELVAAFDGAGLVRIHVGQVDIESSYRPFKHSPDLDRLEG